MAGKRGRYRPGLKRRIVDLVRAGRSVASLASEFEVSEQSIRNWVKQADVDEGRRDGLTTEARAELRRLKRENKRLRMERDILKKAEAWFAEEGDSNPSGDTSS
jgi:transposase